MGLSQAASWTHPRGQLPPFSVCTWLRVGESGWLALFSTPSPRGLLSACHATTTKQIYYAVWIAQIMRTFSMYSSMLLMSPNKDPILKYIIHTCESLASCLDTAIFRVYQKWCGSAHVYMICFLCQAPFTSFPCAVHGFAVLCQHIADLSLTMEKFHYTKFLLELQVEGAQELLKQHISL